MGNQISLLIKLDFNCISYAKNDAEMLHSIAVMPQNLVPGIKNLFRQRTLKSG